MGENATCFEGNLRAETPPGGEGGGGEGGGEGKEIHSSFTIEHVWRGDQWFCECRPTTLCAWASMTTFKLLIRRWRAHKVPLLQIPNTLIRRRHLFFFLICFKSEHKNRTRQERSGVRDSFSRTRKSSHQGLSIGFGNMYRENVQPSLNDFLKTKIESTITSTAQSNQAVVQGKSSLFQEISLEWFSLF